MATPELVDEWRSRWEEAEHHNEALRVRIDFLEQELKASVEHETILIESLRHMEDEKLSFANAEAEVRRK